MSLPARSLPNASRRWKSGADRWSRSGNEAIFRNLFQSRQLLRQYRRAFRHTDDDQLIPDHGDGY